MRTSKITLIVLFSAICTVGFAQQKNGKISGSVQDGNLKAIELASSSLLKALDSSVVKITASDKSGKFDFENVPSGKYLVSVSAIGHQTAFSGPIEISESNSSVHLNPINLVSVSKSLAAVNVNNKKPLIEQRAGKTVLNVEASPTNIGLNALELLQKSPGVTVDNDGNISLKGKQGVMILIDGKPTYMSGADLAAYLKNMQSTSLSQIEIMTNPPAKYDAAGN